MYYVAQRANGSNVGWLARINLSSSSQMSLVCQDFWSKTLLMMMKKEGEKRERELEGAIKDV